MGMEPTPCWEMRCCNPNLGRFKPSESIKLYGTIHIHMYIYIYIIMCIYITMYICIIMYIYNYVCIYIYTHSICNYIIPFCHLCRLMAWKTGPGLGFGHVWSPGYSHSSGILTIGHTASGWFCSIYRTKTLLISLIEGSTNLILITWFNVSILWMLITMKSSPRK